MYVLIRASYCALDTRAGFPRVVQENNLLIGDWHDFAAHSYDNGIFVSDWVQYHIW